MRDFENEAERLSSYYPNMGPFRMRPMSKRDMWRYSYMKKYVIGDSLLDVGAYRGDFLKLFLNRIQVYGTEVNEVRVKASNHLIGSDVVLLGFRSGNLDMFSDKSVDTVTCFEVLEHLNDDVQGLRELVRVARMRVIVTVPYNEMLTTTVCIHCGEETPNSGHLRSYTLDTFRSYVEQNNMRVLLHQFALGHSRTLKRPFLPQSLSEAYDRHNVRKSPHRASWIACILDKAD